jgi:hypothetical protein
MLIAAHNNVLSLSIAFAPFFFLDEPIPSTHRDYLPSFKDGFKTTTSTAEVAQLGTIRSGRSGSTGSEVTQPSIMMRLN